MLGLDDFNQTCVLAASLYSVILQGKHIKGCMSVEAKILIFMCIYKNIKRKPEARSQRSLDSGSVVRGYDGV